MNNEFNNLRKDLLKQLNIEKILDKIEDGIMIVDPSLKIIYYNPAMGRIDKLSLEYVIGKNFKELFPNQTYKKSTILQALEERCEFQNVLQTYTTYTGVKNTVLCSTFLISEGENLIGVLEITKDISNIHNMSEKVIELQDKLIQAKKVKKENVFNYYTFEDIIGDSPQIIKLIEQCKKASSTSSSVLIQGETGTGKELFAQSIHSASKRVDSPFIAINCAAVPQELLEGLMFGTAAGAFTDAIDRPGLFEQAHNGTLLLDEINSMNTLLQAKLLRVLQEKKVRRVGGNREMHVDVRILSTSNVDLKKMIEEQTFRKDLYYRLSVIQIKIPPLRERSQDINELVVNFINDFNQQFDNQVIGCSEEVIKLFKTYHWPGNVRELRHVLESCFNMIQPSDQLIDLTHLPMHLSIKDPSEIMPGIKKEISSLDLESEISEFEKKRIIDAITQSNGNIAKASKLLGIKRQTLQYKMKKHGISKLNFQTRYKPTDDY